MDSEIQKSDLKLTEENRVPVFSATASNGDLKIESNGIIVHDDGYVLNTNGNGFPDPNFDPKKPKEEGEELFSNDHDNAELYSNSPHSQRSTSGDYVDAVAAVALSNSGPKSAENDPDVANSCVSPVGCSGMLPPLSGIRRKETRKWRRIRREFEQDETLNKDSTKMLKRGSSDLANPSSVNETLHNVFPIDPSNSSFSADAASAEDRNSKSSTTTSISKSMNDIPRPPGRSRDKQETIVLRGKHPGKGSDTVDASKKPRGEAINIDKECTVSNLESEGRGYDGEHGDNGPSSSAEDDASLSWKSKGRDKNHQVSGNWDPLVDCLQMLQSTQEALEQEIEKFGELGKDLQPFDDDSIKTSGLGPEFCAASSYEDFGTEIPDALKAKLKSLTRKFEILDIEVEHAKRVVRKKETKIGELVATVNNLKSTNEELQRNIDFHQKNYDVGIGTEHKSVIRAGAGKMQKRIIKFTLCLIVFIFVFELYISHFLSKATLVLPT